MILLDFSQTAIAAISAGSNHFGSALTEDAARHMILNMLQSYKKKFTGKYGELMICCDGPNNWRRDVFPYYKAKRRENKAKAESPIDWEMVYRVMNQTISDLDEFFPYKVIQIVGAEGDERGAHLSVGEPHAADRGTGGDELLADDESVDRRTATSAELPRPRHADEALCGEFAGELAHVAVDPRVVPPAVTFDAPVGDVTGAGAQFLLP